MPDSPALVPGLLTWYRPDLPLTIASRLSPGKSTSLLSLTTRIACLFSVPRLPVAGWRLACSCSTKRPTWLQLHLTSSPPLVKSSQALDPLPALILNHSPVGPSSAVSLHYFPSTTLAEPVKNFWTVTGSRAPHTHLDPVLCCPPLVSRVPAFTC